MSELKPVYLTLWKRPKPVFGYWYARVVNDQPRVSIKLPDQKLRSYPQDSPQEAVSTICTSYMDYMQHQLNNIWQMLAELPLRETHRQGFRPGWLNRLRIELDRQYQTLLQFLRRVLPDRWLALREGGWPAPHTLRVPWENIDGFTAAGVLWMPEKGFDHAMGAAATARGTGDTTLTDQGPVGDRADRFTLRAASSGDHQLPEGQPHTATRTWGQAFGPTTSGVDDLPVIRPGHLRGLVAGVWSLLPGSLATGAEARGADQPGRSPASKEAQEDSPEAQPPEIG